MIGKTISHYKILEKLGEGGMGVVYKAEDTKLERIVALKFLSLASIGEEEKKRFKREAKAAASLNHPNIATIYAIDEVDEQTFIAMEFIDGKSLHEIVVDGHARPLPLEDAVDYATQIAAGLQAAHEKGVTHRDIKSANVMVTEKGQIKIMDFGLAKLAHRSKLTQLGTTLGTAAYMSPEQSRGENTDHRSDIWSLGVVLYEMISGQMPFKGDYEQAVIYSIQNEEPEPLTALRTGVPIALDGIIAKALAKDPKTRYQHVDELPADLKAIDTASLSRSRISTKQTGFATHFQSAWQMKMPWLVAGLMTLIAAAGLLYGWLTNSDNMPASGVKRATLSLAPSEGLAGRFALSPDGTMLVFVGRSAGLSQLFLRHLDKDESIALAGTEGGAAPFFSPDGRWIGFRTQTKLKKISVTSSTPIDICDAYVHSASWSTRDEIVFSKRLRASEESSHGPWELMRVPAQGGVPEPLPGEVSEIRGQVRSPQVLPDGRHVIFTAVPASGVMDKASIVLQSLESGEQRTLIQSGSDPHYLPSGHIVFMRFTAFRNTLMVVPFDLERLTITGNESPLSEGVYTAPDWSAFFTVSMDGTLIYRYRDDSGPTELAWVNRQGESTAVSAPAHVYWDPRLSPDGQRVAVNGRDSGTEIWVYEFTRSTLTRLTFNLGQDETPFWSPDGRWIAFASTRAGRPPTVFRKRADGSGAPESLWTNGHHLHVECWSPHGRSIIVTDNDPNTLEDIWLLNLGDEIAARPLLQTQFNEFGGRISPDGGWLAYTSDESGQNEVYVRAFPEMDNKVQVSANGGSQPVWASNGTELFYRSPGDMMAVSVTRGETLVLASPKALFSDQFANPGIKHTNYDVSRDGKRFLMLQGDARNLTSLNVVFNWFEDVKRLAPAGN